MKKILTLVGTLVFAAHCTAGVAVIVNPANTNALDQKEISKIFFSKTKSFPDGSQAVPIALEEGSATTEQFNSNVLHRKAAQLKAYWSKLMFTGKGQPPRAVADGEMLELIANNPNMIGYIDEAKVTGAVKVVATF